MAGKGVLGAGRRFVRATEPDQIGSHGPQAGRGQHRDHVTVEVAPRRLTVEQEDAGSIFGSLVEVVDPQGAPILVGDIGVVGLERETGKPFEAVVRGAENLPSDMSPSLVIRQPFGGRVPAICSDPNSVNEEPDLWRCPGLPKSDRAATRAATRASTRAVRGIRIAHRGCNRTGHPLGFALVGGVERSEQGDTASTNQRVGMGGTAHRAAPHEEV